MLIGRRRRVENRREEGRGGCNGSEGWLDEWEPPLLFCNSRCTMRCDRPAMSCGRPDGPAAMSPVRVCARGSSYRPTPFFRLESPFQVGDFFFFFFFPPGEIRGCQPFNRWSAIGLHFFSISKQGRCFERYLTIWTIPRLFIKQQRVVVRMFVVRS